jgi:AcrR family transcriptional regulator
VTSTRRSRSARGSGPELRAEILAAAAELLEASGDEAAVTLRAIARRVGITAPAIYAHFSDREEIIAAVITDAFAALVGRLRAAVRGTPREALLAGCRAYVAFAFEQPGTYRVLFGRAPETQTFSRAESVDVMIGADAFGVLLDCVAACIRSGDSTAVDALPAAIQLWVGLHGYASLRAGVPAFPWPDDDQILTDLIIALARLSSS